MSPGFRFGVLLIFSLPGIYVAESQPVLSSDEKLNLSDLGRKIDNTICINTSGREFENIKAKTGEKNNVYATGLTINGDKLEPKEIKTRGQSTLYFRRKSFSFSLESAALFHHGERTETYKKFYLLSLSMDRNYCNNHLAFEMMENSGLFGLFYSFCELMVNGRSEGIYLVIERPEDWALKKKNSPLVVRRGYDSKIDKLKTGKKTDKDETRKYMTCFRQIYRSLNKYEGEELYKTLSNWLDTDKYMKWLAFNFFVRNGDYTDEVYFFIDPVTDKFGIIPWDYDDVFSLAPHEGIAESRKFTGSKLFFSTEDMLDKKIVADPYLYEKYLVQFRELLTQLTPEVLQKVFENTYAELFPYYSNNEIIKNSIYDQYKYADLKNLESRMLSLYELIMNYRSTFLKYLENYTFIHP
jgi:spore coat protein H